MARRPGTMIKPNRYSIQLTGVQPGHLSIILVVHDRPFAERSCGNRRMVGGSFRNDINRIGIIEESGPGTNCLHILNDAFHDVNRAQRHEESARPLCFLANHAILERNTFIKMASLKSTRPETRQNGVTSLQAFTSMRSYANSQI